MIKPVRDNMLTLPQRIDALSVRVEQMARGMEGQSVFHLAFARRCLGAAVVICILSVSMNLLVILHW